MSLSVEWLGACGCGRRPAARSLACRGSRVLCGGVTRWVVYAAPAFRPRLASRNTALDVRCARKPMRLSATKKKAKKEEGDARRSRQREKQGVVEGTGDGGITPAQRVKAAQHEARRWLGQHFLIDQSVILDAVAAAEIAPGDRILEIGPGTGNLTVELLKQGARIVAVEKDRSLADKLTVQFGNDEKHEIEIHNADFLKWDVVSRFARNADEVEVEVEEYAPVSSDAETNHINPTKPKPLTPNPKPTDRRAKVVANIPYNITSDILKVLLPMGASFSNMVFMFQEEVAQRLLRDEPGQSDYRPMSVRVHYYSTPYYIRKVDAVCFDPPPAVTSCLIGFKPRRPEEYLPLSGTEKQVRVGGFPNPGTGRLMPLFECTTRDVCSIASTSNSCQYWHLLQIYH